MARTRYFNYRLAQLFPPNDEYAATMARLCILWEDFFTEASGGAAKTIQQMDGNSAQWRKLYFLRRSIGTLHEIRMAVQNMRTLPEFKSALTSQPHNDRKTFGDSYMKLVAHEELIKDLRNSIAGGHVEQKAVRKGLKVMNQEIHGMIQIGTHYGEIKFKFAHQLALETMFPCHGETMAETEVEKFLTLIEEAMTHALKMVEFAFSIYVRSRWIVPL